MKYTEFFAYTVFSLLFLSFIAFVVPCPTCDHIICENYGSNTLFDCGTIPDQQKRILKSNGGPLKKVQIKDTLLGLPLYELPLPEDWEVLADKWIAPGNTYIKEINTQSITGYNKSFTSILQDEVKPILDAMDKEIIGTEDYPDLANHIFNKIKEDSFEEKVSHDVQLEVKGIDFRDSDGRRGMTLVFSWSFRSENENYNSTSFLWMEGDQVYFEKNKASLLHGLKNVQYFNDNTNLVNRIINLKGRLKNRGPKYDDFIYDEEIGEMVVWCGHEEKQLEKEKLELSKALVEKGVCPDKLKDLWNDQWLDYTKEKIDFEYNPYEIEYDPSDTSSYYDAWNLMDSFSVTY